MTLKADKWIRRMSETPAFVVTESRLQATGPSVADLRAQDVQYLSHDSAEELQAQVTRWQHARNTLMLEHVSGVKSFRPVTPEDLQSWRPMISPFTSGQVRQIERNGDEREVALLQRLGQGLSKLSKPEVAAILNLQVDCMRLDPQLGLQVLQKAVSYGTSSYGYDVRLARKFKIFTNIFNGTIDPLRADTEKTFVDHEGDYCIIPPHSYILGHTIETFVMPRNVTAVCLGKSTYARCGAIVNVTPIEAGFEGQVVIEISNATPLPLKVYADMGIAQFLFFESDEQCEVSYADRAGKYQGQRGLQTALV